MPALRSARSTGWTSLAAMMKSPSTAASSSLPENAAQVVSPIDPPTLAPCIVPSRPMVTLTTPCCVSLFWPRTFSMAAPLIFPALGISPAKRVAGVAWSARIFLMASQTPFTAAASFSGLPFPPMCMKYTLGWS